MTIAIFTLVGLGLYARRVSSTSVHDPKEQIAIMITSRRFEGEEDFWRVRALIVATTPITPVGLNWEVRRWDGQRFHHPTGAMTPTFMTRIRLWEDDGQLVGAVHPEDGGDAHLQLHPDYRHIEEEMLVWAEEHLAQSGRG